MNPYMQCPRCLLEKRNYRALLQHMRNPCHLDTPAGRREIHRRRREAQAQLAGKLPTPTR